MDLRIPTLKYKIMFESKPLKSIISVRRLAAIHERVLNVLSLRMHVVACSQAMLRMHGSRHEQLRAVVEDLCRAFRR